MFARFVCCCCRSFNAVCSRLQSTLETLQVVLKNIVPTKDALIQLSFSGIQALDSVRFKNSPAHYSLCCVCVYV